MVYNMAMKKLILPLVVLVLASCSGVPPAEKAREHYRQGFMLMQQGNTDSAKTEFSRAVQLDSSFAEAWCRLGMINAANQNYTDAMFCYRKAIESNSEYAEAHYYYGLALLAKGDTTKAGDEFLLAVEADSNHIPAREALASYLLSKGNYEGAYPHYKALSVLKPNDLNIKYTLGVLGLYTGHYDIAERAVSQVLQENDQNPDAHLLMGNILVQQNRFGEAGLELEKAMEQFKAKGDTQNAAKAEKLLKQIRKQ